MYDKKVSVIIVTYNSMKWMKQCLNSLRKSPYPLQIVVIDNCSKDDTVSFLQQQPDIHLIINKKNRGFGQANNQGIEYAFSQKADFFFLLNQDAYIHPDTINKLIETYTKHPDVSIITPVHLNGKGSGIDPYFRDFVLAQCPEYLTDGILYNIQRNYVCKNVPAAGWFFPKKTIKEIGGFDPIFFHYGEDDNYLKRLEYHHRIVMMDTQSFIRHDRESTVGNRHVFLHKKNRRDLLMIATDITKDRHFIIQKLGRQFTSNLTLNLFYLCTGKFKNMWNFCGDFLFLFSNRLSIKNSRMNNKQCKTNWISNIQ